MLSIQTEQRTSSTEKIRARGLAISSLEKAMKKAPARGRKKRMRIKLLFINSGVTVFSSSAQAGDSHQETKVRQAVGSVQTAVHSITRTIVQLPQLCCDLAR